MNANNIRKLLEMFQKDNYFWLLLLLDSTVVLEEILKYCKIFYDFLGVRTIAPEEKFPPDNCPLENCPQIIAPEDHCPPDNCPRGQLPPE